MDRELVTTAEAAALLGCSRRHVTLLIRAGRLPAERLSPRVTLLRRADVEAYAQQQFPRGWQRGKPRKSAPDGSAAPPEGEQPA